MSKYQAWSTKQKIRWMLMKDRLYEKRQLLFTKSTYLNLFHWSFLATYGNNPIVKLTMLAPLFAQLLILQDTLAILQPYNFVKLKWLYFSLLCFSFAQYIYVFICDRDIKDYPSKVKFTQAMEATTSDEELNKEFFNVYKLYFSRYGGMFDLGNYLSRNNTDKETVTVQSTITPELADFYNTEVLRNEDHQYKSEVRKIFNSVFFREQSHPIDWRLINGRGGMPLVEEFESLSGIDYDEVLSNHVLALMREVNSEMLSSHWRAKAIECRYNKLNTDEVVARYVAGCLYLFGTIYFLFTGGQNILKAVGESG